MASFIQLTCCLICFTGAVGFLPRIVGHEILDAWNLPPIEIVALQSLYNATDGPNWAWTTTSVQWNFSGNPNPCLEDWYGINCTSVPDNDYVHVHSIDLKSWGLTGTLPCEIENFAELTVLDLFGNTLTGTLPPVLGSLTQLRSLDLNNNDLSSTLPPELGNLTHLLYLGLFSNSLTGTLPPELGSLTQLERLDLSNYLTGTLPPELCRLTKLRGLDLYKNDLTGILPPEMGNLTNLQHLNLNYNGLTGTLPPELGNLTHLLNLGLHSNYLNSTLPPELGSLTQLRSLDLYNNYMTGTLPPGLGYLTELLIIYLDFNYLTGILPPELGNLAQLRDLDLNFNELTGTVPPELGNLTLLLNLGLFSNYLTGTLPPELGSLTQLQHLDLTNNYLTGTLPPDLGNLAQLQDLYLYVNSFTGTLPPELGNLAQLQILGLSANHLTGIVPSELSNVGQLLELYLAANDLSGTLPPELGKLGQLQVLNMDTNHMTGPLPPELGNLVHLLYLGLYSNYMTGILPPELENLDYLMRLEMFSNDLTGTIPPQLGSSSQLLDLDFKSNHLTGTLPRELGNLVTLRALQLDNNKLTDTLPPELGNLPVIGFLNLGSNEFTGTLPTVFSQLQNLAYLSVASNQLWGCVPSVVGMKSLQEIDISHNHLRCSLEGVFDGADASSALLNVQLGDNQFTGTLPAVLFTLPKLQTLVAVSNCFTGTLPQEICQATALQSLILDGVGASRSCPTVWTTWEREGQLRIPNRFHGTIPECVFSLPVLTTLHLSGNNLVGSLPESVPLERILTQLYLSHNLLTGSIPEAVQTHSWDQLDLSYNRFSGSLQPNFGEGTLQGPFNATASVVVNNSRLSGEIPATVLQLPQVSMLGSNMFSCKADKSDVPNTDGNGSKERYQCGSDSFNYAFYLFLSIAGVASAVLLLLYRGTSCTVDALTHLSKWSLPVSSFPTSCQGVFAMISVLCQVAVYCCVSLLLVLVPWYIVASHYYGTYTHQYAWVVSAAFLSGLAPGLVEFFLWVIFVLCAGRWAYWFLLKAGVNSLKSDIQPRMQGGISANSDHGASGGLTTRIQAYIMYLGINLVVVIGVNVAFVYVSLNESSQTVLLAQVALSLFKFGWNSAGVPYLIRHVSRKVKLAEYSNDFFRVQAFVGLFNNIAIPCLVVAAESPSCFYDVLFPPAQVTSTYATQNCHYQGNYVDCTDHDDVPGESSFSPQFSYSYECSSSFVTNYSATMVYFALTAAVLVPAVRLLLCWLVNHTSADFKIHHWCNAALPRLWRVPPVETGDGEIQKEFSGRIYEYLSADNLMVSITVYLGILLSFGVVFPPVALAMCVAMLSTAYQTRLAVGRLLCNAREVGAQHVVEALERDCRGAASLDKLQSVIVMAIVFACYFYVLFIFDTIGDAEGFAGACWVLALWVSVPVCAAAFNSYRRYGQHAEGSSDGHGCNSSAPSMEMVELAEVGQSAAHAGMPGVEMAEEGRGQTAAEGEGDDEGATVSALHA